MLCRSFIFLLLNPFTPESLSSPRPLGFFLLQNYVLRP
jgi:hypothetical protein